MKKTIEYLFSLQIFRFLVVGVGNTIFSYFCFVVFMYSTGIKEVAATLNMIVCVLFNYFTSSRFVFHDNQRSLKKILSFYSVYFATYPLGLLHLHITVDLWGWNVYYSQFVSLFYMPFISFFLQRLFVFRKKKDKIEGDI